MQPRRQAFSVVLARAKARNEIKSDLDGDFVFDLISGAMLYGQIFQPTTEAFKLYIHRALKVFLCGTDS